MRLSLGKRAGGHGGGGGKTAQRQRVVEQSRRPLAYRFELGRAQLAFHPRPILRQHPRPGLQERLHASRGPAGHMGGEPSVALRQQVDDGAGLPVRPRRQHIGLVFPFHGDQIAYLICSGEASL